MSTRQKRVGWLAFGLIMVGLGVGAVSGAVAIGSRSRWPAAYPGSLSSRLEADYSSELDAVLSLAPVRLDLIRDLLADEGGEAAGRIPPGPVATWVAELFEAAASVGEQGETPLPVPSDTPTPSLVPTITVTRVPSPSPTPRRYPTRTPTPVPPTPSPLPTETLPPPHVYPPTPTPDQVYPTPTPSVTPTPTWVSPLPTPTQISPLPTSPLPTPTPTSTPRHED